MQNDLNSLLFEGKVDGSPRLEMVNGEEMATFRILCRRWTDGIKHEMPLDVVAYGALAERCNDAIHEGMVVRVVGPIRESPLDNGLFHAVIVKHIEYKEEKKGTMEAREEQDELQAAGRAIF